MEKRPTIPVWTIPVWIVVALGVYLVLVTLMTWSIFQVRDSMLEKLSRPKSQADWQKWRDDVRKRQARGDFPVKRRVPKSSEPNLLVLLRDHFGTCLSGALFFTSLLYLVMVIFLRGAFFHSPRKQVE